jgi:hypothetical protein
MTDSDRIAYRHKTFQPTMMRTPAGSFRVHLINVSATGALVHVGDPPARGTRIAIDLGTNYADAHVIWTNGARFGVAFERAIDDRIIDRLVGR